MNDAKYAEHKEYAGKFRHSMTDKHGIRQPAAKPQEDF